MKVVIVTVGNSENSNEQRIKRGHKAKIRDPDATRAAYKGVSWMETQALQMHSHRT